MKTRIWTAAMAGLFATASLATAQQVRSGRLSTMDRNHDGVVSREEWTGDARLFDEYDWNADGVLSGRELQQDSAGLRQRNGRGPGAVARRQDQPFPSRGRLDVAGSVREMDTNRDGRLTRREWRGSRAAFDQLDGNRDGLLSGTELDGIRDSESMRQGAARHSRAWQAGYERGRVEGLQAGREDHERNQGWDLEGQRELETADSGYVDAVGPRAEYQAGYRDAFREGYREGYGR